MTNTISTDQELLNLWTYLSKQDQEAILQLLRSLTMRELDIDQLIPDAQAETAEIVADAQLMDNIKRSIADMQAGRIKTIEQVEHELGL